MSRGTDPAVAELARRFPRWQIWRGISGRWFARRPFVYMAPLSAGTADELGRLLRQADKDG